jgi:hypothetical protein
MNKLAFNGKSHKKWRLPLFESLLPLTWARAWSNLMAGISLAALNIPQAMGYTKIAGMPVVTGLYTLLLPLVAFAAFGSSRYLVVAADSATAAILAGGLAVKAVAGSEQYVALAGLVALLTALFLLLARFFRLGFLADFLSRTLLVGFLTGVGFQVGIAVLGEMLRLPVHGKEPLQQLFEVLSHLRQTHLPTLGVAAAVVTDCRRCRGNLQRGVRLRGTWNSDCRTVHRWFAAAETATVGYFAYPRSRAGGWGLLCDDTCPKLRHGPRLCHQTSPDTGYEPRFARPFGSEHRSGP